MTDLTEWIVLAIMLGFAMLAVIIYGEQARRLKNDLRRRRERDERKQAQTGEI